MTEVKGFLRDFRLSVPEAIYTCNGIKICGRRIKSVLFSTDVSIIRNSNADAVMPCTRLRRSLSSLRQ